MKYLIGIRLIHWYHFINETIPIDKSFLLTGDNTSGKSTILDAIQFLLVADLTVVKFNQAANESGERTLEGYTRFKLGTEDGTGGGQKFERKDCTSYITLEFQNDDPQTPRFIVGCVLDSYEDSRPVKKMFFCIPNESFMAPCNGKPVLSFLNGNRPFTVSEFKKELRNIKGATYYSDVRSYRNFLRGRLGRLHDSFHRLLVKSLSFKPMGKVRDFVFNYLLEEKPVDSQSMEANLANYKDLSAKADDAKNRIKALLPIKEDYSQLEKEKAHARTFTYLILRAELEDCRDKMNVLKKQEKKSRELLKQYKKDLERLEENKKRLKSQINSLQVSLINHENYLESEKIKENILRLREEAEGFKEKWNDSAKKFIRHSQKRGEMTQTLEMIGEGGVPSIIQEKAYSFCVRIDEEEQRLFRKWLNVLDEFREAVNEFGLNIIPIEFVKSSVSTLRRLLDKITSDLRGIERNTGELSARTKKDAKTLQSEIEKIEKGGATYKNPAVQILKDLVEKEVGLDEVYVLCDIIDVTDEKWQNAVEAYLNTRRFDLIVQPGEFDRALKIYESNKTEFKISGVGLVNAKEVEAYENRIIEHSLAEKISTPNLWARGYINFLMGDLICCKTEQELKNHRKSITDTCMVYQNYAARQTPFHIYKEWYIGERGKKRQLEMKNSMLEEISKAFVWLTERLKAASALSNLLSPIREDLRLIEERIDLPENIKENLQHVASLEEDLKNIDLSQIEEIKQKQSLLENNLNEVETDYLNNRDKITRHSERVNNTITELSLKNKELEEKKNNLKLEFPPPADSSSATAEERKQLKQKYEEERKEKDNARIITVYRTQKNIRKTAIENLKQKLITRKAEYNNRFYFSGEVAVYSISDYLEELIKWEGSQLPEYEEKITKAKEEALQQLAEDVIHKLRENLDYVKQQFRELNGALKEITVGTDRYKFIYAVRENYKEFYQMVMESAIVERHSLFEEDIKNRYSSGPLEELFQSLVTGSTQKITEEIQERADYREYFNYDVEITHDDGQVSLLSRVAKEKSGGETQSAYYIAILASMWRIYRLREKRGTIGLVIFDEAFSKMDESRIKGIMDFAGKLGMQLILATPKERCDMILPHVTSCSLIIKDDKERTAMITDFRKYIEQE